MTDISDKAAGFLPLTEATYYILVLLVEPRHGYGIMQNVASISRGAVSLGPGTLYGALTNLLKQGLIERAGELESRGERRKVYGLTKLGRQVLALEVERLGSLSRIGEQFLKKIGGKK
jgi:DNA-binding PadR family transcriptional regulator